MPRLIRLLTMSLVTGAVATPAVHAASEPEIIVVVKAGDHDELRRLIADGTPVDARHGDGATALHWAAYRGDRVATDLLIEAGATVDVANDLGATPLWLAASGEDAAIVQRLLESGADPSRTLRMGETALMAAARAGQTDAVRWLLAHGAEVDARERERGQTALMWAAAERHADVVRLLTAHGADVHARSRVWVQLENTAGNTNGSGNFEMRHGGSTALLFVARNGDLETARALLEAGADVQDTAASGTSALVVAAHSGHADLARLLLGEGADPDADEGGYTALHAAVLRSEVGLVSALLEHGGGRRRRRPTGDPGAAVQCRLQPATSGGRSERALARREVRRAPDPASTDRARGQSVDHAVQRRVGAAGRHGDAADLSGEPSQSGGRPASESRRGRSKRPWRWSVCCSIGASTSMPRTTAVTRPCTTRCDEGSA